jgi:hypothetical protein
MTATDAECDMRLDWQLDEVGRRETGDGGRKTEDGGTEAIDAETLATLRELHALASRPVPDSTFVQRLGDELVGAETSLSSRVVPPPLSVILRDEGSRLIGDRVDVQPRSLLQVRRDDIEWWRDDTGGIQNDTSVVHNSLPFPSLNGHGQLLADTPSSPPWWHRWEIAAALLVILTLGGYLTLTNLGRTIPPLSRLSAITAQTEGTAPAELRIGSIGIGVPIERRLSVAESPSPEENLWATGWLNGAPVPMAEPGEPFAAAWLDGSAAPGEGGNIVLHGHLDYWDTSPALFGDLEELISGDRIDITGANDTIYSYEVEWSRRFPSYVDEDQQRDILGPTAEESLTLITGAGAYERETNRYPEALVVRAHFVSRSTLPVMVIPDPAECQATPRTVAELDAAIMKALPEPSDSTLLEALAGEAPDAATMDAVIAAERELVAGLNASDALRAYGLYTDDGLARLMEYVAVTPNASYEWVPDFSELAAPATPLPDAYQLALISVEDVRVLPDGRVAATVKMESGGPGMLGIPTGIPVMHIFKPGERFLIDEFYAPTLMGTPTP